LNADPRSVLRAMDHSTSDVDTLKLTILAKHLRNIAEAYFALGFRWRLLASGNLTLARAVQTCFTQTKKRAVDHSRLSTVVGVDVDKSLIPSVSVRTISDAGVRRPRNSKRQTETRGAVAAVTSDQPHRRTGAKPSRFPTRRSATNSPCESKPWVLRPVFLVAGGDAQSLFLSLAQPTPHPPSSISMSM